MRSLHLLISSAAIVMSLVCPVFGDEVKTDYNHKADFSNLHTFSIGQITSADPFYIDRIRQAITQDLTAKGWRAVPLGGDVTIFVTGTIRNQQQLESFYNAAGWGGAGGFVESTPTTYNQKQDHLVVDIFRSNSKELLWRGISTVDIGNKAERNASNPDNDIRKMLNKFPPKAKITQ